MQKISLGLLALVLYVSISGCSRDPVGAKYPPVTGKITMNSKPLAGATVTFIPTGTTAGNNAFGTTDESGQYELKGNFGSEGAAPGDYKVAVSLWLLPNGQRPAPDVPPVSSGAMETVPARFSDSTNTILKANVGSNGGSFNFDLKSK